MSSLGSLSRPAHLSEYTDWDSLRSALNNWSIRDKFTYRTPVKKKKKARYICEMAEVCRWRCTASMLPDGMIQLRILDDKHTCSNDIGEVRFTASASKEWLDEAVPIHLNITKSTKPAEIVATIRVHYSEAISYQVALLCLHRLTDGDLGAHRYSFQLLPSYFEALEDADPGGTFDLTINETTGNFERCFICPSVSREGYTHSRPLFSADGTFMTGRFTLTLLLAVCSDANGHNITLAWAVVESENESSWTYFLRLLKEAIPEVCHGVFISDRDKGLLEADALLGPTLCRAYCCKHLDTNFREKAGAALSSMFWRAARAVRPAQFDAALVEIGKKKPAGETYLRNIPPQFWAKAHFPRSRYDHDTSNIGESENSTFRKDRSLPIHRMLDAIWARVMGERSRHRKEALESLEKGIFYTQYCNAKVIESRKWYGGNTVQVSSPTTGRAVQPNGNIHTVDIEAMTCSCGRYQENRVPCGHAVAFIYKQHLNLSTFLPAALSTETWAATYATPMPLVDIGSLAIQPDYDCNPPQTRVPRGRPRKKRLDRAQYRARRGVRLQDMLEGGAQADSPVAHRCSSCGEIGHNSATCRRPHM